MLVLPLCVGGGDRPDIRGAIAGEAEDKAANVSHVECVSSPLPRIRVRALWFGGAGGGGVCRMLNPLHSVAVGCSRIAV